MYWGSSWFITHSELELSLIIWLLHCLFFTFIKDQQNSLLKVDMAKNGNDLFEFKPVKHLIVRWNILTFDHTCFFIELNGRSYVLLVMCSVLVSLVVWVLCTFLLAGFGLVMSFSGRAMFWFTHTFNIFFVFIIPSLAAILRLHQYLRDYFWKVICIYISTCVHFYLFLVIFTVHNAVHIP